LEADKKYVIYYVWGRVKWYYANCFFKPFMPGLINAFVYHSRESAERDCITFENNKTFLIEEI
jgi:hypothetical protein